MLKTVSRYTSMICTVVILGFACANPQALAQYDEQQWWNPGDWFDEQSAYNLFTDTYWEDRTYGADWGDEEMLGDTWDYDDSAWGFDEDYWGDEWGYEGATEDVGADEFGEFGTDEFGTDEFDEFGTDTFGLDN